MLTGVTVMRVGLAIDVTRGLTVTQLEQAREAVDAALTMPPRVVTVSGGRGACGP